MKRMIPFLFSAIMAGSIFSWGPAESVHINNEPNKLSAVPVSRKSSDSNPKANTQANSPQNVIIMVGDGMGLGQLEIARLLQYGRDGRLFIETLPHTALVHTYSANNHVTDSAAGGTALSLGKKTNNEMIGVTPDGEKSDSILMKFKKDGKATGVVSTNTITDATPAAFTAHVPNRWAGQPEIARQQFQKQIDVLMGGGGEYFTRENQDGVDLVKKFKEKGYSHVTTRSGLMKANGSKLLGLFHPSYMNFKLDRIQLKSNEPSLAEMTQKTIETLSKNQRGFFAVIEGARIDHASHAADFTSIWKETIEFDDAVKTAVSWAKENGRTLVLVVADHETMGISATEAMDIQALKKVMASTEYIASQLKKENGSDQFTAESVKHAFRHYAGIPLTEDKVDEFNKRVLDKQGKVYGSKRIAWEVGSMIAEHCHAGSSGRNIRALSSTGGHTGNMVPIFAYGIGSEVFDGIMDNVDIPRKIAQLMGYSLE